MGVFLRAQALLHDTEPGPAAHARPVLILRSCRPAQFAAAVSVARDRYPGSEIVALSHAGHLETLRSAGVDRVLEFPGTRFTVFGAAPWRWLSLRAEKFETVIVPQMTADPRAYNNLHWVAALLRSRTVLLLPGEHAPEVRDRRQFARFLFEGAMHGAPRWLDQLLFLVLLAVTSVLPRHHPSVRRARPRVLHVIPSLGMGGAQRQLFEVINATPPDRFDVSVVVLCDFGAGFARQWLKRDDVTITYLTAYPTLTLLVRELTRHCRDGRYDIVHTWLWLANWVGVAAARFAGVPRVITSVRSLSVNNRALGYGGWWHRMADVLGSRAADIVTVNADALAHNYSRWALRKRRRIEVVHNGLDPSDFRVDRKDSRRRLLDATGAPEDAVLIGTVGRLSPEKNHRLFLRIVEQVRLAHPTVHGVIVGDGVCQTELERTCAELGLGTHVTFLGQRADAARFTAGLDVFVLPSFIEGFPNALLEAVFLGVPSVASRVGGSVDVLGERSLTFDVNADGEAIATVLALLDDRAGAAVRADEQRQRALDLFTSDRTASHWCRLYDSCCGGPTARPRFSVRGGERKRAA